MCPAQGDGPMERGTQMIGDGQERDLTLESPTNTGGNMYGES